MPAKERRGYEIPVELKKFKIPYLSGKVLQEKDLRDLLERIDEEGKIVCQKEGDFSQLNQVHLHTLTMRRDKSVPVIKEIFWNKTEIIVFLHKEAVPLIKAERILHFTSKYSRLFYYLFTHNCYSFSRKELCKFFKLPKSYIQRENALITKVFKPAIKDLKKLRPHLAYRKIRAGKEVTGYEFFNITPSQNRPEIRQAPKTKPVSQPSKESDSKAPKNSLSDTAQLPKQLIEPQIGESLSEPTNQQPERKEPEKEPEKEPWLETDPEVKPIKPGDPFPTARQIASRINGCTESEAQVVLEEMIDYQRKTGATIQRWPGYCFSRYKWMKERSSQ